MAPPPRAGATNTQETPEAASGRHAGVGSTTYGEAALRLLDNGYAPLPLVPGEKRPIIPRWSAVPIDLPTVQRWTERHATSGIGLRTGTLVGVDIDILDPDLAHEVGEMVRSRLGDTLMRVGQWPKRVLLYRTAVPFAKMATGGVEILAQGQQLVAFGRHPATRQVYQWPLGETPLDVPLDGLPLIDAAACALLLGELAGMLPTRPERARQPTRDRRSTAGAHLAAPQQVERDARGRVIDGRDRWLSTIAYHALQDAVAAGRERPGAAELAAVVWDRFAATADTDRVASHGRRYSILDAERKVADKLRLLAEGKLPPRVPPVVEAGYQVPALAVAAARERLEAVLVEACRRFEAWSAEGAPAPRIGVKATVGLGKSTSARRQLLALRQRLIAAGRPSRILVLTPSHALADEAACAWRADGVSVAVLRGYEAVDPRRGTPMCRDIDAVRAAVEARLEVHETACAGAGRRCGFFEGCLKQRNRAEVAAADVVLAAHQALFTGFAVETGSIAAIVIDEGLWASAVREPTGIAVEALGTELLGYSLGRRGADDAIADLHELRGRAVAAMIEDGPVSRARLLEAGLDPEVCRLAASLEARRLRDLGLYPGMPETERQLKARQISVNAHTHAFIELWQAMADLVSGDRDHDGRLQVRRSSDGMREVALTGLRPIHPTLRDKPILHLDATLRPELAAAVLPGLEVQEIEAATPHMTLRLVAGSFGKSALCPEPRLDPAEAQRRANRLREVVDYVAWHARRVAPARVLVVTYKACEAAFANIPGVETGHFNAIAGLDAYRDVRLLVVVGRPLPSDLALVPLVGALFRHWPEGGYVRELRGVRMRDGSSRGVRVTAHPDDRAELIRAAICDDQVLQAIGRGRGVNRTADVPLEVHVLADVALPLAHDELVAWEMVQPDLMQRMLMSGMAVDSPGDAARLDSALFASSVAAEKAFQRERFGGHFPIRDLYRGMSVKSAAYRRPGRGRAWQRAWWIDGNADAARSALEAALGALAEWKPDP